MFKLNGTVEIVLFHSAPRGGGSRAKVWFPKSRIARIEKAESDREHDAVVFDDSNEWLLAAKEGEAVESFVFLPIEVQ